jgi:Ca2+-binding RTX toxin-like protein
MGRIQGTAASETLIGGSGRDEINGLAGNDVVRGGGGNDVVTGDEGDDYVYGDDGDDILLGGPGVDYLFGGLGNDELNSGAGADILEGGAGADIFRYRNAAESTSKTGFFQSSSGVLGVDTITDLQSGTDKIMLSDVDANLLTPVGRKGTGNEAFTLVNTTDGVTPGHLTVTYNPETNITEINAYNDAQAGADMTIYVVGQINPATDLIF